MIRNLCGKVLRVTRQRENVRYFSIDKQNDPATQYLNSLGYTDPALQKGMTDALTGVFGQTITVDNIKSLGDKGLEALSNSVRGQLILQDPNASLCTVHVKVPHHNFTFDLKMKEGENFMTCITEGVGKEVLGEYLECACGGNMSCSTCHVILDEVSYSKLSRPCQAERDMLDLAFEPTRTSRLGCQIIITRDIDGMTVTIPSGVNNMWT